jgi:hypothetical protein
LLSFSSLDGLLESLDLSARGSPSAACTSKEMGRWIECWTPPQCFGKLTQGELLQPRTPLHQHMGTVSWKCPSMVCASNVVQEGIELWSSCDSTYISCYTIGYLDVGVQDAAHQALTTFVKNFEILIANGLVRRRRRTCKKLRIFKHGREFRSEWFKHY